MFRPYPVPVPYRMGPPGNAKVPIEIHLLQGCFREAERADIVAICIDQLRVVLDESFHGHMILLAEAIRGTSRLLRDLADRSQVFVSRVPVVINYLNVLLPCLCRSLRDITSFYEDKTVSKEIRCKPFFQRNYRCPESCSLRIVLWVASWALLFTWWLETAWNMSWLITDHLGRKMYNSMTDEAAGLPLPQRFVLYNHFLTSVKHLLTR
jgi:hypothetical protein